MLAVMDLAGDADLAAAGTAREVVNRVQRLRKRAGLRASDALEVYLRQPVGLGEGAAAVAAADGSSAALGALLAVLGSQEEYVREALGVPILPASQLAAAAIVATEQHAVPLGAVGEKVEFEVVLVRPAGAAGVGAAGDGGVDLAAAQLAQL